MLRSYLQMMQSAGRHPGAGQPPMPCCVAPLVANGCSSCWVPSNCMSSGSVRLLNSKQRSTRAWEPQPGAVAGNFVWWATAGWWADSCHLNSSKTAAARGKYGCPSLIAAASIQASYGRVILLLCMSKDVNPCSRLVHQSRVKRYTHKRHRRPWPHPDAERWCPDVGGLFATAGCTL